MEKIHIKPSQLESEQLAEATAPRQFFAGLKYTGTALWKNRSLISLLFKRDLKSRYKDSSLGILWSLVRPLALLVIYYVAIGQFLGAARSIPNFAIFVFSGLTIWGLFAEVLSTTTRSILDNAGLVKKVALPTEIFPIAATGSALFYFVVQFSILLVATLITGLFPGPQAFVPAVLAMILMLSFSFAVGLLFAALNVYFRDIQHFVEVLLLVLFWASPIVYSFSFVKGILGASILTELYLVNPVTLGVLGFQKGIWGGTNPQDWPVGLEIRMLVAIGLSWILIVVFQRVFARLSGNFAQEI